MFCISLLGALLFAQEWHIALTQSSKYWHNKSLDTHFKNRVKNSYNSTTGIAGFGSWRRAPRTTLHGQRLFFGVYSWLVKVLGQFSIIILGG